ncbi:MAG: transglutaminase-like domain-containing protein, partial [Defluviitaleaceae bacterium]|nr:transglutaminase-like domain-containing protein [Defluviitaleaceae bacterium]
MRNESVLRRPLFTFGTDLAGNPKLADTMYLMTVGVLLAWSLVSNVISNTMLTQDHVGLFWRVLIVMVVLRVVFHNRFTFYTVFGVFVVANAMLVWEMMFANEPSENALAAVEFISGVVGFTVGLLPHTMAYEQAIVWALCFGMALFVIVFGYLRFNFFMLLGVSVITVALSLNFGFFTYVPSFYAFVICTLVNLVKYLNTKRGKLRTQNSYFALYAIPMILVCLAAAFVMPKPEDGFARYVTTTLITTPLDRATSWIHAMFRPKHFSLAQTGFGGGDRRLGGNVVVNDDVVMRIRTLEPVYLTGNTLDWYTGYSWVNSTSNEALPFEERGTNVELYERATSVMTAMLINGELDLGGVSHTIRHISRYFGPAAVPTSLVSRYVLLSAMDSDITFAFEYGMFTTHLIDVHIGNFRTFSAFHTGILSDIYGVNADMQFLQDKNGAIITESLMPRNTVYRVVHHELSPFFTDISMPALSYRGVLRDALDMLNQQEHSYLRQRLGRGNSEIHNLMATRFGDNGKLYSDILRNYLIPHADRIYEIYTALPENFPQRVVDLARYVTETAENDYERARMIEVYLLRFGYTLTPGNTPIGRDFVEYFLFYQQEGYCTYFASAFVTMARAVGLPARYVEGFNVTGFPDAHGFIDVTNDQGHAWGEVYFEGYGWMRFEPTPGGGGIPATYDPEDNFPAFLHWDDQLW